MRCGVTGATGARHWRLLAREGMMSQVADEYSSVRETKTKLQR